ncbi:MAG TPA: hypothetical protein VM938_03745 [Acidimicrobiales bacterium]|nr:hypothetical protein [Acidimicrobiales bacterium]
MDAASLRPLGVGEILDVAIKLYRNRFLTLVKAVAVVVAPVHFLSALVELSLVEPLDREEFSTIDPATGLPEVDVEQIWAFVAAAIVLGFAGYLATQLATGAAFRIVSATYLGEDVDWPESLRFARKRLWALIWLSILMGFVIVIGFLFCIVPGIYLWAAFSVAIPVLFVENVRGTRALKRSRSLTKGRWWPVAAVVFLGFLLGVIVSGMLTGVVELALGATDSDIVAVVVGAIGATLAGAVVTPFTAAVATVLYFDLRVRKEGFDVELLARDVGVAPPAGARPTFLPPPPPPPPSAGAEPPFWPPPPGWRPPDA